MRDQIEFYKVIIGLLAVTKEGTNSLAGQLELEVISKEDEC